MTSEEKFIIARWAYSVGKPIITDAEYTLLLNYMEARHPDSEYLKRSWSSDFCPKDLLLRYGYDNLVYDVILSDKTESIPSLNSWYEIEMELNGIEGGTLSFKHDGWNMQASYHDGNLVWFQTRGRSSDAMEAQKAAKFLPQKIPYKKRVTVVMEATVDHESFEMCKRSQGVTSQRACVSTVLSKPALLPLLSFHAFDILCDDAIEDKFGTLRSWGFRTPEYINVTDFDSLRKGIYFMSDAVSTYLWPTDGLVYKGKTTRALRVEHWEEPIYKSYILTPEECEHFGVPHCYAEKYGAYRISVGVHIYPIKLRDSTQREIPLNNIQRIIDNELVPGSPIAFAIVSGAIADVDLDATKLLQQTYYGRYDEYRTMIREGEKAKCL